MSDKGNGILPDYCFHTHTFRCGHAAMSPDEEYVEDALRNGYRTLGFADHAILPGIHERGMRGDYSLLDGYISSILSLRKKYEGKIRILLGFEGEYSPEMEGYYRSLLKEKGFDYLILGSIGISLGKILCCSCLVCRRTCLRDFFIYGLSGRCNLIVESLIIRIDL